MSGKVISTTLYGANKLLGYYYTLLTNDANIRIAVRLCSNGVCEMYFTVNMVPDLAGF